MNAATKKSTKKRPRSLVTGACVFMGSHMLEVLHAAGHEVIATDLGSALGADDRKSGRFPSVARGLGIEVHASDMRDPSSLAPLVEDLDYVFHIASIFNYLVPWEALLEVNVEGARSLVEMVLEKSPGLKRLVLWGAGGVYGMPNFHKGPFTEDMPPSPGNDYLRSKWFQESMVMDYGAKRKLPWAIMRPTSVYGPRCVYGTGPLFMDTAQMKVAAVPKNFTSRIPFVHVRDVCEGALHLAVTPAAKNRIFNLNDDSLMTNVEFFQYVAEVTGHRFMALPPVPMSVVKPALMAVARILTALRLPTPVEPDVVEYLGEDFLYDNTALKSVGYQFRYPDARTGIKETIEWYRDQGWITY